MPSLLFGWNAVALFTVLAGIASALLSASDYYVPSELIPGLSSLDGSLIPEMYAGHIPLTDNEDDINYFFWKFLDNDPQEDDKPLMIWLNGGPGCSSMDGALAENGPIRINDDGKAVLNEGSWITRADIVYVDQPVNTGFSFANKAGAKILDDDLDKVTEHFMQFLDSYFKSFPDDKYKKLMLAGESYAGQYIPFFADAIMKHNEQADDDHSRYNLKSLFIGNGWIDPNTQSLSFLPFAIEKNIIDEGNPNFSNLIKAHESCQNTINSHGLTAEQEFSYHECDSIITSLLAYTRETSPNTPPNEVCLNVYDYTLRDSYPSCGMNWPKEVLTIPKFFGTPGVLDALNIKIEDVPKWRECDEAVSRALKNPRSKPSIHLLPSLLETGLDIVLYNGDHDLICNNRGVLDSIANLNWGGKKGFSDDTEYYDWVFNDVLKETYEPAGYLLYERNLTFISVYNASHMVSNDNSMISRGILDIYMDKVLLDIVDDKNVLISTNELHPFSDDGDDGKNEDYDDEDEKGGHDDDDWELDEEEGEEEDDEDEEYDGDLDGDHNDEDQGDSNDLPGGHSPTDHNESTSHIFKIFLLTIMSLGLTCAIAYYIYLKKFKSRARAILIRSNRKHDQNKSVTWADDLEGGVDFDVDEELSRQDTAGSKPKSKGSYTSVPSTDMEESFELDDF